MSIPRLITSVVFGFSKAVGKAASASGQQMVKNFKYKPEGVEASASGSSSSGSAQAKSIGQMGMTLEEAHLILNTKKDSPMEIIQKNYESIFAANGPRPEPVPKPGQQPSPSAAKRKAVTHSHYLQSKVFRALERIKAERGESLEAEVKPPTPEAPTSTPGEGGAKL